MGKILTLAFFSLLLISNTCFGAVLVVDNTNDSGTGSLRQALIDAQNGDTIQFASGLSGTIAITSTLFLNASVSIQGPGSDQLQINGSSLPSLNETLVLNPGASGSQISGLSILASTWTAIDTQADVALSQVTLSGNGGWGLNIESAEVSLNQVQLIGNQRGGIFAELGSVLNLFETTLADNQSTADGGGIALSASTLNVSDSTLSGNGSQANGGGIALSDSTLVAENLTLSGNTAVGDGGGVAADGTSVVNLSQVTVTLNEASAGGGISLASGTLRNTLLAGNLGSISDPDCSGSVSSLGGNVIGDNQGCTLMGAMSNDQQGSSAAPIDPNLAPLDNAGGSVETHVPQLGSPAIDKGSNTDCPGSDARGTTRPLDGLGTGTGAICDVGAVEVGLCQIQFAAQSFSNLKLQSLDPLQPTTLLGRLENLGPDYCPGLSVSGTLPDGVQLLGVSMTGGTCTLNGSSFSCELGNFLAGNISDFNLQIQVVNDSPATYQIQAVASSTGEITGDGNTLTAVVSVGAPEQDTGGGCQLGRMSQAATPFWALLFGAMAWFLVRRLSA